MLGAGGDPAFSFANARDWDPIRAIETAFNPDAIIQYLNTAIPLKDEECNECIWLPLCAGGCPHRRLNGQKACIATRNDPEKYVLALYTKLAGEKRKETAADDRGEAHRKQF